MEITGGKRRMIILWIGKGNNDKSSQSNKENDKAAFQMHDESIRKFRLAHLKVEEAESKALRVIDNQALAPLQKVGLCQYARN